jgi:hypothetical protein
MNPMDNRNTKGFRLAREYRVIPRAMRDYRGNPGVAQQRGEGSPAFGYRPWISGTDGRQQMYVDVFPPELILEPSGKRDRKTMSYAAIGPLPPGKHHQERFDAAIHISRVDVKNIGHSGYSR